MILSIKNIIFTHLPKTGGTSLNKMFKAFDLGVTEDANMHCTLDDLKWQTYSRDIFIPDFKVVTIKRNPWCRYASEYVQLSRYRSLIHYVDYYRDHEEELNAYTTALTFEGEVFDNIHYIDFDTYDEDVTQFWMQEFGVLPKIKHVNNKTPEEYDLQEQIINDQEYIDVIAERCSEDINLLGYLL